MGARLCQAPEHRLNLELALTAALIDGAPAALFRRFDAALTKAGFLGRIIAATIIAAPPQPLLAKLAPPKHTEAEKQAIKEGGIPSAMEGQTRGAKRVDIAISAFGGNNPIGIDRALIRAWKAAGAARHDGALWPDLPASQNASGMGAK